MKVVFMGTPSFAVPSLNALLNRGHGIVAVVTQPDRPAGRGQRLVASPVKELALARGLPVEQPEKLREPQVADRLKALEPEVVIVAAYGKILPKALLDLAPRGAINVHGSLLPKYRGAAPIQRAILAGDRVTGVTIMQMNERMDAGDVLLQREMPIGDDDTSESLSARMSEVGARALVETLDGLLAGVVHPARQREEDATLAPMIRKEEGEIDWSRPAVVIERAVRAFTPWPSAYTRAAGKLCKVLRARPLDAPAEALPGTIVQGDPIAVATGRGLLTISEVQLEGTRRMTAREALAGRWLAAGMRLK